MNDILLKKIDSLPPLPETIIKLEEFKRSNNKDLNILLGLIEKDPLIVSILLKTANSSMFGFHNKVETTSKAINLLGVNFTLSIAFSNAVKQAFNTNLEAYDAHADDFMKLANMSSNLLSKWIGRLDQNLREELILPIFLSEAGRFVLSNIAADENTTDKFLESIRKDPLNISEIEKEFFKITSTQVTSRIFEHWNLGDRLINSIKYIDDVNNCPDEYKKGVQIMHVVKIICNVCDPMSDQFIEKGIEKAEEFGLNIKFLEKAIEQIQDRLLDG